MTDVPTPPDNCTVDPDSVAPETAPLRIRYRIRFAKTGLLRWIGHMDLLRLWERLMRRASLNISMTEGFNPKPRFVFPSAMALGIEGTSEVMELELAEDLPPAELLQRLIADNQPGLTLISVKRLPDGFGKAQLVRTDYVISAPTGLDESPITIDWDNIRSNVTALLARDTVTIPRKKKQVTLTIDQQIAALQVEDESIALSLLASNTASLRLDDVLNLLGLDDWIANGSQITRTGVHLENEFETSQDQEIAINQAAAASLNCTTPV
ncbi:hypothetical protein K227x_59660 [Rubripirellula lacrimiformis]|uniref:DUF2344 domain-containing protein n=1 Tax=Rubripirellula lacrimiformis TaxID=1930273 RepID=A0A517NK71_9BACT|nr:TIGR03936 family radical SAM-associated protein [Rubripirellula lacrimiformis]QDT07538.1 hypothetical protein K227x_59660 [Rubripirellula lacrimiformis]